MYRMSDRHTRTDLGKLAVIRRRTVWVGKLRSDGRLDGRTKLRRSPYHTRLLQQMTPRELLTKLAREGYQVEMRRN